MSRIRLAALLFAAMAASPSAQDKSTETLREAWIGTLTIAGVEPVMQFRIMDLPTGEPVA
jgi:hypothetical protein